MKKIILIAVCGVMMFASCGTYTGTGAYAGASLGGMLGSAIGGISGGWRGSDIGTVVGMATGAVVGATVGAAADAEQCHREKVRYARQARRYHIESSDDMYSVDESKSKANVKHSGDKYDNVRAKIRHRGYHFEHVDADNTPIVNQEKDIQVESGYDSNGQQDDRIEMK